MTRAILTLNAGSSSLKFAVFACDDSPTPEAHLLSLPVLARGAVTGLGERPQLTARDGEGRVLIDTSFATGGTDGSGPLRHETFLDAILGFCQAHLAGARLDAVGHRIVHGADAFSAPTLLTPDCLRRLEALVRLAPLHQPHNLAAVRAAMAALPGARQVGCFDTAFHQTLSPLARRFGLPRRFEADGVRRYGFHGLSYSWLTQRLAELDPELAQGRVIYCHLGSGASLCAAAGGVSQDTTMGFTALDGLVMSTRCGALDPGVILYLIDQYGMDVAELTTLLYQGSGLVGLSGLSGDMRTLLADPSSAAKEAVELFTYRIAREMGALTMSLGGLDGVVFSAGIGENSPEVRARIAARCGAIGLKLDDRSGGGDRLISAPESQLKAWVIATDEERVIAAGAAAVTASTGADAAV